MWYVALVAIVGTVVMLRVSLVTEAYMYMDGTRRFHLRVPNLRVSCDAWSQGGEPAGWARQCLPEDLAHWILHATFE